MSQNFVVQFLRIGGLGYLLSAITNAVLPIATCFVLCIIHSLELNIILQQNEKRDEVDTEEEWEATPFCDVSFVGDNVLINGKSSLRKDPNPNKVRARRIKFNDEATTLYEYPSEDSLIDEPSFSETRSPPPSPTPSPLPNTPIGGATLSRYTPSKSPAPTGFELGVTSTVSVLSHTQHSTPQPLQSDEYLKPVNMDQEMAWSQETTSDILF
uniref:PDZ and LIM domain protein 7 n=1 Tax=Lygus hesperus TaxID=30085 RepID=A0A0A9X049_LYGHE